MKLCRSSRDARREARGWAWAALSPGESDYQGPSPGSSVAPEVADTLACQCLLCPPCGMATGLPTNGSPRFRQIAGRVATPFVMYFIPYLRRLSTLSFKVKNNHILTNYLP